MLTEQIDRIWRLSVQQKEMILAEVMNRERREDSQKGKIILVIFKIHSSGVNNAYIHVSTTEY